MIHSVRGMRSDARRGDAIHCDVVLCCFAYRHVSCTPERLNVSRKWSPCSKQDTCRSVLPAKEGNYLNAILSLLSSVSIGDIMPSFLQAR